MTEDQIKDLVKSMTLDEKIGMIHGTGLFHNDGVPRLGIPRVITSDGPMGVRGEFKDNEWMPLNRKDDLCTYLPCNSALASTFNRELAFKEGDVLGSEARARGKDVILAPGINIKRSPLCGRNFEYFSDDGYLTAELAVPFVKGVQQNDVAACVKHFAVNNQETQRMSVDTEVEENVLKDVYLEPFRRVLIEGKAYTVMGAYNKLYGDHCCESKYLLRDILRDEWKYPGVVISDWGGVHDSKKAADGGCDLEMSVTYDFDEYKFARPLKELVESGKVAEELIDEKVFRLINMMDKLHMLDGKRKKGSLNTTEHRQVAYEVAAESVILLKNEDKILPLDEAKTGKVLVIGENAITQHSLGGGSAEIKALYEIAPLMGIKSYLGGNAKVDYLQGYEGEAAPDSTGINWQEKSLETTEDGANERQMSLSKERAKEVEDALKNGDYDTVIYVGGLNHLSDTEGFDRDNMKLPFGQSELINLILKLRQDAIIVLMGGSAVEMGEWIDKAKTVLWSYYCGCEGGYAIADTLFGKNVPSGRLPETFYKTATDSSALSVGTFGKKDKAEYKEGYFVGYKYTDKENIPVQFPFGYGLSYTSFEYTDEKAGDDKLFVTVKNTGNFDALHTVMAFGDNKKTGTRDLIGFEKVFVEAGKEIRVEIKTLQGYSNVSTKRVK